MQSFLFDFRQAFRVLLKVEVWQILLLIPQGKLIGYVRSHCSVVEGFIQDSLYQDIFKGFVCVVCDYYVVLCALVKLEFLVHETFLISLLSPDFSLQSPLSFLQQFFLQLRNLLYSLLHGVKDVVHFVAKRNLTLGFFLLFLVTGFLF